MKKDIENNKRSCGNDVVFEMVFCSFSWSVIFEEDIDDGVVVVVALDVSYNLMGWFDPVSMITIDDVTSGPRQLQ